MTLDYCDISNWSVADWSFSVHYKSLVIGFLRWSAPAVEPAELWEEPACGGGGGGSGGFSPCLRGPGMSAPQGCCLPP